MLLHPEKRDLWLSSYLTTYVEHDGRQIMDIGNLRLFEAFLALAAARHGQDGTWPPSPGRSG
jgi:hypothetical protein